MTSLYKEWKTLIENQTDSSFDEFWKNYSSTEERIYSTILDKALTEKSGNEGSFENAGNVEIKGKFSELAKDFDADPVIFEGFLDGINESLKNGLDIEKIAPSSGISLDIDLEKLYFNMLKAGAKYLYDLPQWDSLFSGEKKSEIQKTYKRSKTLIKDKKTGRNEPCPCGSGKKYKHCCGKGL